VARPHPSFITIKLLKGCCSLYAASLTLVPSSVNQGMLYYHQHHTQVKQQMYKQLTQHKSYAVKPHCKEHETDQEGRRLACLE